jgi:hypothetical protein
MVLPPPHRQHFVIVLPSPAVKSLFVIPKTQKADVVKYTQVFHHVGLLFNQPPPDSGCRSFSRPNSLICSSRYFFSAWKTMDVLGRLRFDLEVHLLRKSENHRERRSLSGIELGPGTAMNASLDCTVIGADKSTQRPSLTVADASRPSFSPVMGSIFTYNNLKEANP